jgi:hypothetical protein
LIQVVKPSLRHGGSDVAELTPPGSASGDIRQIGT